jgi:GNAT superfamily N-acetyltransferase
VSKVFETLSRAHDREGFDCGVSELNLFLRQQARRQQGTGVSRTFVLVEKNAKAPKKVFGFFTLVASELDSSLLSNEQAKRLPNRAPCLLLARLAVSKREQGKGLGGVLLAEAIYRTLQISSELGVTGLFVEAKDDVAASFYRKFGFTPFPSNRLKLFQSLKSLKS